MNPEPVMETRLRDFLAEREYRRRLWFWGLTGVFCLVLVAVGMAVVRASRHLAAATRLQAQQLEVDWYLDDRPFWQGGACTISFHPGAPLFAAPTEPVDWSLLKDVASVDVLDLTGYPASDDALVSSLGTLANLRELNLPASGTGRAIGRITDRSLKQIGRMSKLKILVLSGQRITDAGLRDLLALTELEDLDLDLTRVTDAGLLLLKTLPKLKYVRTAGTKVTPEGIAALQVAAPKVTVLQVSDE